MESPNVWRTCARGARVVVALNFVALVLTAQAQEPAQRADKARASEPVVVERGPHHRVWERKTVEVLPNGRSITNRSSYTELATGMHYLKDGQWLESKEEIEIFQGAAVARQGQHSVIFAAQLNSPGAIDLLAPGGQRFRSHVLGLYYTDYASGRSIALAEIKDSTGERTAPNQVTYPDAFDGDCVADVRYSYTKAGFEQDIILRSAPPSPAEWGLNPETTRLEVFTEFIEAPEARVTSVTLKQETDAVARQTMKEPDLVDQRLDFGGWSIDQGQAFPVGSEADAFSESSVQTGKSLERIDGRLILIEKVDYPAVREQLGRLPKSASLKKDRKVGLPDPGQTMLARLLPSTPTAAGGKWRDGQYASLDTTRKGFVLDYVAINSSLTNYVLQGDTTYHVTNTVNFYGTTVIDGGVVVKFNTNATVNFNGPIDCRTFPYQPAIFTCKDDESVGETVSGSTGNPLGRSASYSMACKDTTTTYDLHDIHIRHSLHGVTLFANVKANISNLQVIKGGYGLSWLGGAYATSRNFMFYDLSTYAFFANGAGTNRAEHGTFHKIPTFLSSTSAGRLVTLTNSLLISVTNNVVYQGANVQTNLSDTGIFQKVGGSSHYLATNSSYVDAGTTNIDPNLLASVKTRTVFAPLVYSNVTLTTNLTLGPQVARDTNAPDLGYHFEPLDHVFGGVDVTANLTFAPGTAAGWFRTSSGSYHAGHGIHLGDSNVLTFDGRATTPNYWVRCNVVQEEGNGLWSGGNGPGGITGWTDWSGGDITPAPQIKARFTRFAVMNGESPLRDDSGYLIFRATDSEFWSGKIVGEAISLYLTNCLMQRFHGGQITSFQGNEVHVRNCTWIGGQFQLDRWNYPILARIRDSAFDGTAFSVTDGQEGDSAISDYDYNSFTNSAPRTNPTGAHDVLVSSFGWQTNGWGLYYLPTNSTLINTGSVSAASAGLFHYTTMTSQLKEGTSMVDIGFHHVAIDLLTGRPSDWDKNGIEDYLENLDRDGDGVQNWLDAQPDNPAVGVLSITIDSPTNGASIY